MKRIVFLSQSYAIFFITFVASYLFGTGLDPRSEVSIVTILLSFLILLLHLTTYLLLNLIMGAIYAVTEGGIEKLLGLYSIFFGVLTTRHKRIYYSDLGEFYVRYGHTEIDVYRQDFFASKHLFSCDYYGDIDGLKRQIESKLRSIYSTELEEKERKKKFLNWDGYVDTTSKRDDKLKKILP